LDARDDDVLGGGRVDGGLGRHRHLLENALVRRVRELNERRYLPVAQVPDHLLLEQRLLHVRRVDGHGQPPALDLLLHREQRAARRRRVLAPGAIHLADRALERQRDVRRDPEHVALLAVHNWRVRHRRLEPRAPAEHLQRAKRRPRAPQEAIVEPQFAVARQQRSATTNAQARERVAPCRRARRC